MARQIYLAQDLREMIDQPPNKTPEPTPLALAVSPKTFQLRHTTVPAWLSFFR
jgi:hypothetical protein